MSFIWSPRESAVLDSDSDNDTSDINWLLLFLEYFIYELFSLCEIMNVMKYFYKFVNLFNL